MRRSRGCISTARVRTNEAHQAGGDGAHCRPKEGVNEAAAAWLQHYFDWFRHNVVALHWTEEALVHHELGYAGTAYLLIEHALHGLSLVDLKTMRFSQRAERRKRRSQRESTCHPQALQVVVLPTGGVSAGIGPAGAVHQSHRELGGAVGTDRARVD